MGFENDRRPGITGAFDGNFGVGGLAPGRRPRTGGAGGGGANPAGQGQSAARPMFMHPRTLDCGRDWLGHESGPRHVFHVNSLPDDAGELEARIEPVGEPDSAEAFTVASGPSRTIGGAVGAVQFTPRREGNYQAWLVVRAADGSEARMLLRGEGYQTAECAPGEGGVTLTGHEVAMTTESPYRAVTVTNACDGVVTVSDLEVAFGNLDDFQFHSSGLPRQLEPGQSMIVDFEFHPVSQQDKCSLTMQLGTSQGVVEFVVVGKTERAYRQEGDDAIGAGAVDAIDDVVADRDPPERARTPGQPLTVSDLNAAIAKEAEINKIARWIGRCVDAAGKGVRTSIHSLLASDEASKPGDAELMKKALSVVFTRIGQAAGPIGNAVGAMNSFIGAALKQAKPEESANPVTSTVMGVFEEMLNASLEAQADKANGYCDQVLRPRLRQRDIAEVREVYTELQERWKLKPIRTNARTIAMVEWVNFLARRKYGAMQPQEGGDGHSNVNAFGEEARLLLETRRTGGSHMRAQRQLQGIMRIGVVVKPGGGPVRESRLRYHYLPGVHAASVTAIKAAYPDVGTVPVNKVVDLWTWYDDKDPTPVASVFVTADGVARVQSSDSDTHVDTAAVYNEVKTFMLAQLTQSKKILWHRPSPPIRWW